MLHLWGESVQHLWLHRPRTDMARSARLFLCARCRDQVLLCPHCDRGQGYCSRACSVASRHERRRHAAQLYQDSRCGRLKHAARAARQRARRRSLRQYAVWRATPTACAASAGVLPANNMRPARKRRRTHLSNHFLTMLCTQYLPSIETTHEGAIGFHDLRKSQ